MTRFARWWQSIGPFRQAAAVMGISALAIPAGGGLLAKAEGGPYWASVQTMLGTVAVMAALLAIGYALLGPRQNERATLTPYYARTDPARNTRSSGYERACLLELRIAKVLAWLLALGLPTELALAVAGKTFGLSTWQTIAIFILTAFSCFICAAYIRSMGSPRRLDGDNPPLVIFKPLSPPFDASFDATIGKTLRNLPPGTPVKVVPLP